MTTATKTKPKQPKPTDPQSAARAAAETLADASRSDRAADAKALDEARAAYVKGLLAGDAELIAEAGEALGVSPEAVAEDGHLAQRLQKLQQRADARDEVAVKAREARRAMKELERRFKDELMAAQRLLGQHERDLSLGARASGELQNLRRTRPEFFDGSGRLLSTD